MKDYRTLINFLILQSPRGIGQTTQLVNLAKKIDATYVCFNTNQKINLKQEFGINVLTIDEEQKLFGNHNPILIDHFASLQLFNEIIYENKTLKEEIEFYKKIIDTIKEQFEYLKGVIDNGKF
jgi:hypothetical protein